MIEGIDTLLPIVIMIAVVDSPFIKISAISLNAPFVDGWDRLGHRNNSQFFLPSGPLIRTGQCTLGACVMHSILYSVQYSAECSTMCGMQVSMVVLVFTAKEHHETSYTKDEKSNQAIMCVPSLPVPSLPGLSSHRCIITLVIREAPSL